MLGDGKKGAVSLGVGLAGVTAVKKLLVLSALSLVCGTALAANSPKCGDGKPQHSDLLTSEQWHVVRSAERSDDPVMQAAIALDKRAERYDPNLKPKDAKPLAWSQVRKLVLLGAVDETWEHLNNTVQVRTIEGQWYVSKEPHHGDMARLTAVVDPCGVYIPRFVE